MTFNRCALLTGLTSLSLSRCLEAEHVSKAEHASSTGVLEEEEGGNRLSV